MQQPPEATCRQRILLAYDPMVILEAILSSPIITPYIRLFQRLLIDIDTIVMPKNLSKLLRNSMLVDRTWTKTKYTPHI